MPTKQQLFDMALAGVRKQGRKSITTKGRCAYTAWPGLACAIGHCIPDEQLRADLDSIPEKTGFGSSIFSISKLADRPDVALLVERMKPYLHPEKVTWLFLEALQRCHDTPPDCSSFMTQFEEQMAAFARSFELKYTPPGPLPCGA